ncbi:hypothetical protein BJH93_12170 [Kocuria polaris]|nr:hypothetical protein [Kocuria polaris]
MSQRRPTAQDVAKRAGASRSAVSMVMNGNADGNVAPDMQERIRSAAAELEYTPNPIASGLRRQRSQMIGIVTDEAASSPFAGRMLAGASKAASERGYLTVIADAGAPNADPSSFIDELRRRRVDGLLLASQRLRTVDVPDGLRLQPGILTNCRDRLGSFPSIIPDEVRGGREAAEHLIGLGHRRIAWIGGDDDDDAAPARIAGLQAALAAVGLPAAELHAGEWDIRDGYQGAERIFERPADQWPDAIFCACDRVAVGVLLYAGAHGISVPGDVSVMGYDDQRHLADATVPGITTMSLPHEAMGREAARRVIDELEGAPTTEAATTLLQCPLVARASTAPRTSRAT